MKVSNEIANKLYERYREKYYNFVSIEEIIFIIKEYYKIKSIPIHEDKPSKQATLTGGLS